MNTPRGYNRPVEERETTMHGHHDHAAMFRRRFWISLVLTVPVVLYSHMLMSLTGWTPPGSAPGDPPGELAVLHLRLA